MEKEGKKEGERERVKKRESEREEKKKRRDSGARKQAGKERERERERRREGQLAKLQSTFNREPEVTHDIRTIDIAEVLLDYKIKWREEKKTLRKLNGERYCELDRDSSCNVFVYLTWNCLLAYMILLTSLRVPLLLLAAPLLAAVSVIQLHPSHTTAVQHQVYY